RVSQVAHPELEPFVLRAPASITGSVRRADGRALADVEVALRPFGQEIAKSAGATSVSIGGAGPTYDQAAFDLELAMRRCPRTRADGSYRLYDLAPGRYRISAFAPGAGVVDRREVELGEGAQLADVDLALSAAGTIGGRVLDPERRALAGAWVLLIREG